MFPLRMRLMQIKDRRISRLFEPALENRRTTELRSRKLQDIGSLVGLNESEVSTSTEHYRGAFSRFCSRMLLVIVLGFFTFIILSILAVDSGWNLWSLIPEDPVTTYTPGTRYGSISPSDFGEVR